MRRDTAHTRKITAYPRQWVSRLIERARIHRVGPFMAVVFCSAALFAGLYSVWQRMQTVQTGYEIATLERKNRELKKRQRELTLEIATLESPGELEKKASKVGLALPEMGKVVHVP